MDPIATLQAAVPDPVRRVCSVLVKAGHEAVTVGGAVRDALLGRPAVDWDVATSAFPDQVQRLFRRTVPTGLQHGTVTVLVDGEAVEVTTFRGEGAYSDGRRPDSVSFGVSLDEDLARRDFVVNAIAFDPAAPRLHDPFGGQADLAARRLRAVGDPAARFREDGLRVMRAARFVATLGFALEPATEAAIAAGLPSLARVSQERVRDELVKLLAAPDPAAALAIVACSGIAAIILPELAGADWTRLIARVAASPADPLIRVVALLAELGPRGAEPVLRRLRLANVDRERAVRLLAELTARAELAAEPALRRLLARVGPDGVASLRALWAAERVAAGAPPDPDLDELGRRAERIVAAGDALAVGDLALGGRDLMTLLGLPPGPAIGRLLGALLERVIEEPALNTRDRLAALARELHEGAP